MVTRDCVPTPHPPFFALCVVVLLQVPVCNCHKAGGVCDEACLNRQLYIECAPDLCCTLACQRAVPAPHKLTWRECTNAVATTFQPLRADTAKPPNQKHDGDKPGIAKSENVKSENAKSENEKSANATKHQESASGPDARKVSPAAATAVPKKRAAKHSYCLNTRIQRMDYPTIDIFHTANKGWGLRTLMPLREGMFVGEYCGEVITKDECAQRVAAKAEANNYNLYCATLMGDLVVDAEYYGGYVSGLGRVGELSL